MGPLLTSAVIIDDEIDGRNMVAVLLKQFFPDIVIKGQAENVAEASDLIRSSQPDLIFLDVEMPDGNAFDLLVKCSDWQGHVILVTAHDHYAIRAIKASVVDYLLKPLDEQEFFNAVNKVCCNHKKSYNPNQAEFLLDVYKHLMIRKIRIPTMSGFSLVNIDDIVRCEARGNYTILYFINGKNILASRKLGEYENELKGYGFVRVHSKHLVNSTHIIEYNKGKSGGGYVVLQGRELIEVSARRKGNILDLLG